MRRPAGRRRSDPGSEGRVGMPGGSRRDGGRRGKEKELAGVNLLGLAPRRLAGWEEVGGRVVVIRPMPFTRGLRGLLDRFLHQLSAERIRLDEVGSFAWQRLDGKRTVAEVAELLREEFGDRVEPAEERLGHMVLLMRRDGLLAYPGWDEAG
jgi:hypothetical protein